MIRDDLIKILKQLPKDTKFFVRHRNKYGDFTYNIFRDANDTYQFYFTTFYQMLDDKKLAKAFDADKFLNTFSIKGLTEICHHGRSILGTCSACDDESLEFAKKKMPELEIKLGKKYNITDDIRSNLIKLHEQHQLDYSDELTQDWLDLYDVYILSGGDDDNG